jgi:hypothetical protein
VAPPQQPLAMPNYRGTALQNIIHPIIHPTIPESNHQSIHQQRWALLNYRLAAKISSSHSTI